MLVGFLIAKINIEIMNNTKGNEDETKMIWRRTKAKTNMMETNDNIPNRDHGCGSI